MDYQKLPKVELHLHLDCSLSFDVVKKINPAITYEEYYDSFVAPPKCTDLLDYISRSVKGFELMQTKEQLRLVTLDLFDQLKADNVIYAEIRFAPLLHIAQGLTPVEVVQAVIDAAEEGISITGVQAGLIVCTLRNYTEAQSMETVKLAELFKGTLVCGFDIAGDEAGYPVDAHIKAFEYANANGIKCTSHAGEARGSDSVWEVLKGFHPSRIGHGVRSAEDEKLLSFLKEKDIHLEVCPTSNIQTNVYDTIYDHTANKIYDTGVSMSVNTDSRTITPTTLSKEYEVLEQTFGWEKTHFYKCNLEAVKHCFATAQVKAMIKEKIITAWEQDFNQPG